MSVFISLAIVMGLAALGGIIAKLLKQPAIIGYIFAGILLTAMGFSRNFETQEFIGILGQVGVTLLLFLVGLELPVKELSRLGKTALITGIGQIVFTAGIGYVISILMGFSTIASLYLSLALAFSSTVIVVNLLSTKNDLQSLYGRISVGFLLVQDFVAIGILVFLAGLSGSNGIGIWGISQIAIKGLTLVVLAAWLSEKIMPKILDFVSQSSELLFIVSVGWCLAVAALVGSPLIGFSPELGGFLAGIALASVSENKQIISKVKPLRDFFVTLFFVFLGSNIQVANFGEILGPSLIFSTFVLIGNPIILMILLGLLGFKKRVAFLCGLTVAQISEFSFIIVNMAYKVGHVDEKTLSVTALVGLITMLVSTYLIIYAEKLYHLIGKYLPYYEHKSKIANLDKIKSSRSDVYLIGHNRIGKVILPIFNKMGVSVTVVDFDPQVLHELTLNSETKSVYGDISDMELYRELELEKSRLIISTVSDINDNNLLLEFVQNLKVKPILILVSNNDSEAKILYNKGADFILVPHSIGGEYLATLFEDRGINRSYIIKRGLAHAKSL